MSQQQKIDEAIVIKDYYVVLALKKIFENNENLVFIGGTSLSKCFGIINRFSEDIDLVALGETRKSRQRQTHLTIQDLKKRWFGFIEESNQMFSDFKELYLHYPANRGSILEQRIKIELITFMVPFPVIPVKITSMIQSTLDDYEKRVYDMHPIQVLTQSPYRTMIEKILLQKEQLKYELNLNRLDEYHERRARDFYDIHKIWQYYNQIIPFDTAELEQIILSRIDSRRKRTSISIAEFDSYRLSDIFQRKHIAKQLNETDYRKLSIRDLDTHQIEMSLIELDRVFHDMISQIII